MDDHTTDTPLKRCSKCGEYKPATTEYFYKKLDKLASSCKVCRNASDKRVFSDPERALRRKEHGRKTREKYHDKYKAQKREHYAQHSAEINAERRNRLATDPEYAARIREQSKRSHTKPEYLERNREAHRVKYATNPEYRQRNRDYHKRPDVAERRREKRRDRYANDPQYREKARNSSRASQQKYRAKYKLRSAIRRQSPEGKAKRFAYNRLPETRFNNRLYRSVRRSRLLALPIDFTDRDWQLSLEYFNGVCPVCERQFYDLLNERTPQADHWIPLTDPRSPGTIRENMIPLCGGTDGCNQYKSNKDPETWLIERYGKRRAQRILARIKTYFEWIRKQPRE